MKNRLASCHIKPGLSRLKPYFFISPFFISFIIFMAYPAVNGFFISLQKYLSLEEKRFVALENYAKVLNDPKFHLSIKNTVLLTLFGSILTIITLSLFVGLMINSRWFENAKGAMTTIIFMPNITSVIVVGIIFTYLLKTDGGVINEIIGVFEIGPFRFLKDPQWALFDMILLTTWRYLGINTLYVLSGLQNIPGDVLEAARIEGASNIQMFFRIKLPLLKPIMEFIFFQAIVGSFSIFGEPYMLVGAEGGTQYSMLYPNMYIYSTAFKEMRFGYSAAIGFVLGAIILLITTAQRFAMNRKD